MWNREKEHMEEIGKGTQFSTDNQPAKNGRYPLVVSEIIKEAKEEGYERVGPELVLQAYEALLGFDRAKIKLIKEDHTYPMILQIVAGKMLDDEKAAEMLEKMLDRAHGKALQKKEFSGKLEVGNPAQPASPEQTAAILKVLNET